MFLPDSAGQNDGLLHRVGPGLAQCSLLLKTTFQEVGAILRPILLLKSRVSVSTTKIDNFRFNALRYRL